jgi:flagellar L-ring protein FlgH
MKCCAMPINSFDPLPAGPLGRAEGRTQKGPRILCSSFISIWLLGSTLLCLSPTLALAKKKSPSFAPAEPKQAKSEVPTPGAVFLASAYAPLTSGTRASNVGDVLTIMLIERTSASKSSSAASDRSGGIGLTPPQTGPFSFLKSSDINTGGNQTFKGKGETAQSNSLIGEVSVIVAAVYSNGTMLVRGEKQLTLNQGDEHVQISGIVRTADIGADNRIASTRVADARIYYTGKGGIARASRQGWLQSLFSKISPF